MNVSLKPIKTGSKKPVKTGANEPIKPLKPLKIIYLKGVIES